MYRRIGKRQGRKVQEPSRTLPQCDPRACSKYDSVFTRVSSLATDDTFPDHAHDGRNQTLGFHVDVKCIFLPLPRALMPNSLSESD